MRVITNHVHYITKINQAFPIFLVYIEKHGYEASLQVQLQAIQILYYLAIFFIELKSTTLLHCR